jgi:GTP 3',8-cyclase
MFTLRVSVLQHCQLRCGYCLPQRFSFLAKKNWLSLSDYEKLADVFSSIALHKIRFTGGEPLLRKELPDIAASFKKANPNTTLAITTNGLNFRPVARRLRDCGISAITFHIDSLKEERYERLMGLGKLNTALEAINQAQMLGFSVKINVVVQRNANDDELVDFLLFSKKNAVAVRFIELMDTGSAQGMVAKHFISGQEIRNAIAAKYALRGSNREHKSDPAELWDIEELGISFGLIASDTEPFCQDCNRLRLSADGRLFTCLYESSGVKLDLSLEKDALESSIRKKISIKESFHPGLLKPRRLFSMSQTGG